MTISECMQLLLIPNEVKSRYANVFIATDIYKARGSRMKKVLTLMTVLFLLSAPNARSDCLCNGDFDYDGDVDGTDAVQFKADFWRKDCTCGLALVPKTGQTASYEDYDDGYYEQGIEWPNPRFTDNEDGTVTDNQTGLIWLKDANCFGQRTYSQALTDCYGLADPACGLSDGSSTGNWRLPNVRELLTLIDFGEAMPALPLGHPFTDVKTDLQPDDYYWSSTTYRAYTYGAWALRMFDGYTNGHYKTGNYYVWPIRGGQ